MLCGRRVYTCIAAAALLAAGCSSGTANPSAHAPTSVANSAPTSPAGVAGSGPATPQSLGTNATPLAACHGVGISTRLAASTPEQLIGSSNGHSPSGWVLTSITDTSATFEATKPNRLLLTGTASITMKRRGNVWTLASGCAGQPSASVTDPNFVAPGLGRCPSRPATTALNAGVGRLGTTLVPIAAANVRVCRYVLEPAGPRLVSRSFLLPRGAAAFEQQTNQLATSTGERLGCVNPDPPKVIVATFASDAQQVNIEYQRCLGAFNSVLHGQATPSWTNELLGVGTPGRATLGATGPQG